MRAAEVYTIDSAHSDVSFKVGHRLFKTPGRFNKIKGSIQVDATDMSKSSVEVTIETASINTGEEARDKHLRSGDFFDAATYPAITFKSTSVKDLGQGRLEVTGDFTLRGVTKRITFPIWNGGNDKLQDGAITICFLNGVLKLNRSEYGLKAFPVLIGDEVEISLNVVAEHPKNA